MLTAKKILTMVISMAMATMSVNMAAPAANAASPISYIDTSGEKIKMIVDGQPFFYNATQISFDRFINDNGFSYNDMANYFQSIANDGFTTVSVQFQWKNIETYWDVFYWNDLNKAIDLCQQYGLKMEIIWFGSDGCGSYNCGPAYTFENYEYVCNSSGVPIVSSEGYRKLDLTDSDLLERESYVIKTMMDHIATYINNQSYENVVVGIQVMNEPTVVMFENWQVLTDRSYSSTANSRYTGGGYTSADKFNSDVLLYYANGLSQAVKTSNYPVWTRMNGCSREKNYFLEAIKTNETMRASGGTYLDFIGNDPYYNNINDIYNECNNVDWNYGKNLFMIMENGGTQPNSAQMLINTLAGNSRYNIWEYCASVDDWNYTYENLYTTNFSTRQITPRSHVQSVRSTNHMLNKNWYDLATLYAGGDYLKFFNRTFSSNFNSNSTVGGISVNYTTNNGGAGIASST